MLNEEKAKEFADALNNGSELEKGLTESFVKICQFLQDNPDLLSWRGKNKPDLCTDQGLQTLAEKYFEGFRRSDAPAIPGTVPDNVVSIIMQLAYGYSQDDTNKIKLEHQHSMCAENCVGALLERYLDSVLRKEKWHWCCGDFVKAIDFVYQHDDGSWTAVQIKNRNNTENSSSSKIRDNTDIKKWHRSFSNKPETNWDKLPGEMAGFDLSEKGFIDFVEKYLKK